MKDCLLKAVELALPWLSSLQGHQLLEEFEFEFEI